MGVYLRTKFEVSSIILTSFRQGDNFAPTPTSKRTPKKPAKIKVKIPTLRWDNEFELPPD